MGVLDKFVVEDRVVHEDILRAGVKDVVKKVFIETLLNNGRQLKLNISVVLDRLK